MHEINKCGVSDSNKFHTLWKLPNFPLTELIGEYSPDTSNYNQELVISIPTGHVQLKYQLDTSVLYTENEYAYRTGSARLSHAVDFFRNFMVIGERNNGLLKIRIKSWDGNYFWTKTRY